MSLLTPHCSLRSDTADELVKRTKTQQHQSCENIHITHWPDVYQNILPKPLFDQPELTSGEILADWSDFAAAHSGRFSPKMHSSFSSKGLIEVGSRSLWGGLSTFVWSTFGLQLARSHLPNKQTQGKTDSSESVFSQIKWGGCESYTSSEGSFRVYRFTCISDRPKVVETVLQIFSAPVEATKSLGAHRIVEAASSENVFLLQSEIVALM